MRPVVKIYKTPKDLSESFSKNFKELLDGKKEFHIAISGGSTPKLFYKQLGSRYAEEIDWSKVHLYWVDERCVSPEDEDSNYGMVEDLLLQNIEIPAKNVHRIKGESVPSREAKRYGKIIKDKVKSVKGLPSFDLILLGMGKDGHTASIFPDQMELMDSQSICEVARHPKTGQERISLTGAVINNAKMIVFMITGNAKSKVFHDIIFRTDGWEEYPAAHINPTKGELFAYMDEKAAKKFMEA